MTDNHTRELNNAIERINAFRRGQMGQNTPNTHISGVSGYNQLGKSMAKNSGSDSPIPVRMSSKTGSMPSKTGIRKLHFDGMGKGLAALVISGAVIGTGTLGFATYMKDNNANSNSRWARSISDDARGDYARTCTITRGPNDFPEMYSDPSLARSSQTLKIRNGTTVAVTEPPSRHSRRAEQYPNSEYITAEQITLFGLSSKTVGGFVSSTQLTDCTNNDEASLAQETRTATAQTFSNKANPVETGSVTSLRTDSISGKASASHVREWKVSL